MLRGRTEDALDAIDRALAVTPDDRRIPSAPRQPALSSRPVRRGGGRASIGPRRSTRKTSTARRTQLTVYFDGGRFREALAVGGELIRSAPDNEEYAQAMLQVLNRRFETFDGDYIVLAERPCRPRPGAAPAARPLGGAA